MARASNGPAGNEGVGWTAYFFDSVGYRPPIERILAYRIEYPIIAGIQTEYVENSDLGLQDDLE